MWVIAHLFHLIVAVSVSDEVSEQNAFSLSPSCGVSPELHKDLSVRYSTQLITKRQFYPIFHSHFKIKHTLITSDLADVLFLAVDATTFQFKSQLL